MVQYAVLGGTIWVMGFGMVLIMSRAWAKNYVRGSVRVLRSILAFPFLFIGKLIQGEAKKKKNTH